MIQIYIPPFTCGIIFTVGMEILAVVIYAVYCDKEKEEGDDKD